MQTQELQEAPSERGWRVVLGLGGASPYCDSSSRGGRLIAIHRPESRRLILQLPASSATVSIP